MIDPSANNRIPIPILPSDEANAHAMRYLGQQVREHYEETGKQLPFENPHGSLPSWDQLFNFIPPEEKPQSMFSLFGQECADSIREAKTGVPLDENVRYQSLQKHVQDTFGTRLPKEWFEGWILGQEWSDERLDNFQDWFAHNLECQIRQYISNRDIHVKNDNVTAVSSLLSGPVSVGASQKMEPVQTEANRLDAGSRQFEVISGVADDIHPGNEIFDNPLTSDASRLSSPLKAVFDVYHYVARQAKWLFGATVSTDSTLLHQLGDFFGENTGLEGYNQIEAFKFYRSLISQLMQTEGETGPLKKMDQQLERAIRLSKLIHGNVDHFRNELRTELKQLQPDESVVLSGGWRGDPGGHAIIYEIIKQSDQTVSFRLYNTGEGIQHHVKETWNLKEKVVPYTEISNVALEKVLERPFLRAWQLQQTEIPKKDAWKASDIYTGLMLHLGGEAAVINFGEEDLMTPQRSGTCAFMSLQALFNHINADKSISQKVRFKLLSVGINDYFNGNKARLETSRQAQNLFSKTVEEYSRIVASMHEEGIINDAELVNAKERIVEFRKALDSGRRAYEIEVESSIDKIDLNARPVDWGKLTSIPEYDWEKVHIPRGSIVDPGKAVPSQKAPLFYVESLKDWQPRQETLINDLQSFIKILEKGASDKSHLSVLLEIQSLIQKLDLTTMEFTKEDASKITAQLHALGFMYYENIQRSCRQHPGTHCQMITPKMLLTINTIVYQAAKLLDKFYKDVPRNLLSDLLRTMRQHPVRFMNPELDNQFREIKENIRPLTSFFETGKSYISNERKDEKHASVVTKDIGGRRPSRLRMYRIEKDLEVPEAIDESLEDQFRFADVATFKNDYHHSRDNYPSELYQLYDLGALRLGLEKLPISLTSLTSDSPLHIETKVFHNKNAPRIAENYAVFHPIAKVDEEYPQAFHNEKSGYDLNRIGEQHIAHTAPKIHTRFLNIITENKHGSDSQNEYIIRNPDYSSLQTYRALTGLVTSKELMVKETLSYFARHVGLLVEPDYQAFFNNLMFTPGLLLNELKKPSGHLMAAHLSDFVLKNFEFYKTIGNLKTVAFFLQLNRLFKSYVDYAGVKPTPLFLDTRAEIRSLLSRENLEMDDRWLLNKEMALSYSQNKDLTSDEAEEFLSAAFFVNSFFNTGYNDEKWSRLEIEELIQKHTPALIKLTEGADRHRILNKLAELSLGKPMDKEWVVNPAYPYLKTTDGDYQADLVSCTFNDATSHGFPKECAMHPVVRKIFNEAPPKAISKVGKNTYLATFEGNSYRILQNNAEVIVQREFEIQGKRVWGQYTRKNDEIEKTIPPRFTSGALLWLCETEPASLAITDQKNQLIARADHLGIYQIDPVTNKETGLVLDQTMLLPLSGALARFESKRHFNLWVDRTTGLPMEIDFPRLGNDGVSFKRQNVGGKDRMVSDSFPGYYLAEKQYVKALGDDLSYLLLEKASGEQQVILAEQFFMTGKESRKEEKQALDTSKDYFDRQVDNPVLRLKYYQYPVDPKTGKLGISSLSARFYLGMRHLWKMRYEEAGALLRGFDNFLGPYGEESQILKKIAELASVSGDQDPRATALSLYAAYLLHKNARDFGVKMPKVDISDLYSKYLNQLNNIYGVRLAPEEELLLLDSISLKTKAMVNRLIELDPVKGKLAQAQYSLNPPGINETVPLGTLPIRPLASADELIKALTTVPPFDLNPMPKGSYLNPVTYFRLFGWLSNKAAVKTVNWVKGVDVNKFERPQILKDDLKRLRDLVKAEYPTDLQKADYKSFTGLDFPEKDIDWRKELASTLKLMTRTPYSETNTMAWVFLAALEHPNEISLDEFVGLQEVGKDKFKEFYEQTAQPKLLQLYPQIAQKEISPFAVQKKIIKPADVESRINPAQDVSEKQAYQHSIAVKTASSFANPEIPSLKDVLSIVPAEAKSDGAMQSDLAKLENAFSSLSLKDPVVKREMSRIASSIDLYQKANKNNENQYSLTSLQDLNDYAQNLVEILADAEMNLRDRELDLLSRINRPHTDPVEMAKSEVLGVGQSRHPLTVDDLIYLYWNRDAARFHEANPSLTVDEIHNLESGIQTMLIQATHVQQLKRVLNQIKLISKDRNSEELQEQLKQLKHLAEGTHAYDIDIHPEYLVMEHYANILLHPEQVKNLDLLQIREGKIHDRQHLGTALEMIMGGGKSKVLMVLLAIMNADGDNLSIGILPAALLPTMSSMMAKRLGTGFNRQVEVVEIDRETPMDEAFLSRLQNIRNGKKLMLMADSAMQSLFLNYIEHLHVYSHATKEQRLGLESKNKVFKEIFTLLKEHGNAVIDEVDQILNPRTEKQYTLGSAVPLPAHEIELVTTFYEILESDPAISSVLRFEFSSEATETAKSGTEEKRMFLVHTYQTLVKPRLIEAIMQRNMGVKDPEWNQFFRNLNAQQLALVKDYLSTQSPDSVAFVSEQTLIIKDILALAREEIQNLLPLTCVKLSHQHYGPSAKVDYAIPYHGSDVASQKSNFGTSYETLGYTIQMVIKDGINSKIIVQEIEALRSRVLRELKEDPTKKMEEIEAYQQFINLAGGDKSIPLFGSEIMLEKIAAGINGSLERKLEFLKKYIAPRIGNYEKVLSANPQLYNFILYILNAFSGTQWDSDAFPERLKIIFDEIITGKTLGLLWENRHEPVHVIATSDPKTIVHELITSNPQAKEADALIDTAGLIRGVSRLEIVGQMLSSFQKDRSDIKGIVFYDVNNELMILEEGKKDPIHFSESKLKPEERFTFYDQKHTTGSSIKQKPTAMAIVTIGKNTILRDLLQSVWRLRGLAKSQKVQFTVDEEVKELIFNALKVMGVPFEEPLQLEHLMLFTAYNQAMLQGDNNFRAFKHKTLEVLQQEIFKSFLDPSAEGDQLAELFKSVESLFVQKTQLSPWALFGEPTVLVDSDVAAKNQVAKVVGSPAFEGLPESASKEVSEELDRLVDKSIPLLPNKIVSANTIYGREMEIETEKEQEKEVEKEVEVEALAELSTEKYVWQSYFDFKIVNLSEAFAASKGLETFADIFDDGLVGSLNFLPVNQSKYCSIFKQYEPPFGLFNQFQKPVCALRVMSEDEVVMVDQRDAAESVCKDRKCLGIYDLNLGLYQVEKEIPSFIASDKFLRKVVQAKFFDGETHYKKEEIPLLRQWIEEKGVERMRSLFVNHILKFKDDSRAAYPDSVLDKVLR